MLDCLGVIYWISVHSSHLCHLPQGTPTAHYRPVLTGPWLPPHSHRSRWTTSMTSRTLRVSWHWPRRMPPPSPSLMPNTMYASRRLGRTTRPTCEWKDQGLGRGPPALPCAAQAPWASLLSPFVLQEDISVRKLEDQHWFCDAWADCYVWQVGGLTLVGADAGKSGSVAAQTKYWQASSPCILAGTSCGWTRAQRFLGDWTSVQWKRCMARMDEITSLRWEHSRIWWGHRHTSRCRAATLCEACQGPESPEWMAVCKTVKCLVNWDFPGKWQNS